MSLTARLHIEGHAKYDEGIKILSCDFSFSQETDIRGIGSSKVKSGMINITMSGVEDTEILQWMLMQEAVKNGKISFSGVIDSGSQRTIEFKDAFLVEYHESFSDNSDITVNISLSARSIIVSGVVYETFWSLPDGH